MRYRWDTDGIPRLIWYWWDTDEIHAWDTHEIPISYRFPWDTNEIGMTTHERLMIYRYRWDSDEIPRTYRWDTARIPMIYRYWWDTDAIPMNCRWDTDEIRMRYRWHTDGRWDTCVRQGGLFYRSVQLKKRIYIAMYRKYMGTYEGTDKSRSPGITNLNSLPEGRGPLWIWRHEFFVNSRLKAKNRSSITRRNVELTRSCNFLFDNLSVSSYTEI